MSKSTKVHKSDVKVEKTGSQPYHKYSKGKESVIPYDNDAKLITPSNAGGKGWLPEDVMPPECFDKVNSGGADM